MVKGNLKGLVFYLDGIVIFLLFLYFRDLVLCKLYGLGVNFWYFFFRILYLSLSSVLFK